MKPGRIAIAVGLALVAGADVWAVAEEAAEQYPSRTVTIVAPSAPGGLYSLFARILGGKLGRSIQI